MTMAGLSDAVDRLMHIRNAVGPGSNFGFPSVVECLQARMKARRAATIDVRAVSKCIGLPAVQRMG